MFIFIFKSQFCITVVFTMMTKYSGIKLSKYSIIYLFVLGMDTTRRHRGQSKDIF